MNIQAGLIDPTATKRNVGSTLGRVLGAVMVAAVIGLPAIAHAGTKNVQINFSNGCPTSVTPATIDASESAGDKILWTAVENGAPVTTAFDIYFDPFVGKAISGSGGTAQSQPIKRGVPVNVTYKYTITSGSCAPLDPWIRVR
ncbi:MAG: hypothetical protein HOC23_24285 [Halieaceae bacterium]|nr:hypothetical protein [Halieaceae bacterium]